MASFSDGSVVHEQHVQVYRITSYIIDTCQKDGMFHNWSLVNPPPPPFFGLSFSQTAFLITTRPFVHNISVRSFNQISLILKIESAILIF